MNKLQVIALIGQNVFAVYDCLIEHAVFFATHNLVPNDNLIERLKEQEGEQFKVIRSEIEALSPDNLSVLLDSLKLHLKIKGTTPSVFRRLEEGKWQSALVMGELFRFYWAQTRGVDWKTTDAPLPTVHRVEQAGLFP